MDDLADHFTVYAVDLPGLEDTRGEPSSYDKSTAARYLGLAERTWPARRGLAARDLGAGVAYQLLAQDPGAVPLRAHGLPAAWTSPVSKYPVIFSGRVAKWR